MWTSIVDLDPRRVLLTQLLGRFWHGAYFSSFAPLRVQNLPRQPLPASGWVRVRNRLAGICGSDLHFIYADGDFRIAPAAVPGHSTFYLGHEVVGEVIEISNHVRRLRVGDRVALQHSYNCVAAGFRPLCRSCAGGNYNQCERGSTLPGPHPIGGGWSEEMLLPEQQLFRVPLELTDEQAVMIEPTAVAIHSVLRHLPQPGERVLVIGAGTIGLLILEVLRTLAPRAEVSMLARHPFQIEQATRLGATHIIYPQDSYAGVQQATRAELYHGFLGNRMLLGGFDVIYDTIGYRKTLHHALRWTRMNGTIVLVGISLHMMNVDLTPIWYQETNLLGSLGHGVEKWPISTKERRSTFGIATELMMQDKLRPENLITHRFALSTYQHALITAAGKAQSRSIKVVFDYSLQPPSVVPAVRAAARQQRPTALSSPLPPISPPPDDAELPDKDATQRMASLPKLPDGAPETAQEETSQPAPVDAAMIEDTEKNPALRKSAPIPQEDPVADAPIFVEMAPEPVSPKEFHVEPVSIPLIQPVYAIAVSIPEPPIEASVQRNDAFEPAPPASQDTDSEMPEAVQTSDGAARMSKQLTDPPGNHEGKRENNEDIATKDAADTLHQVEAPLTSPEETPVVQKRSRSRRRKQNSVER